MGDSDPLSLPPIRNASLKGGQHFILGNPFLGLLLVPWRWDCSSWRMLIITLLHFVLVLWLIDYHLFRQVFLFRISLFALMVLRRCYLIKIPCCPSLAVFRFRPICPDFFPKKRVKREEWRFSFSLPWEIKGLSITYRNQKRLPALVARRNSRRDGAVRKNVIRPSAVENGSTALGSARAR